MLASDFLCVFLIGVACALVLAGLGAWLDWVANRKITPVIQVLGAAVFAVLFCIFIGSIIAIGMVF
jgi:hypothetical protein